MEVHLFECSFAKEEFEKQLREDVRLSLTFEYARRADGEMVQLSLGGLGQHVFTKMEDLVMNNAKAEPIKGGWMYRVRIVEVNV